MSQRALARRLGVDEKVVRNAIKSGRLSRSVARGKSGPLIKDADLAVKEFADGAGKPNQGAPGPPAEKGPTLVEAQTSAALERAAALRFANGVKSGRLIDAETARREGFECARAVRDSLLNIPDRLSGELAAERDAARVHARLDEEIRKALETLAEVFAHGQ